MKKSRPARSSSGFSSGNKSSNKFSRPSKSEPERGGRRSTRAGKNRPAPHGAAFAGAAFAVDETIFGKRPLEELLRNKPGDVEALYVREQSELTKWLKDAGLQSGAIPIQQVTDEFLDQLSDSGNHQGVAARVKPFRPLGEDALLGALSKLQGPQIVVIAEEISDPRNLGSLLRVCDGAGVAGIFITERRSAPVNALVRRTSAGASEVTKIAFAKNLQRTLETLKEAGFWIVGTDLSEGSVDLYTADLPAKVAVIFGAEGGGLKALTKRLCDFRVHLPMAGVLQSLNVSTAAAAVLFELARTRR